MKIGGITKLPYIFSNIDDIYKYIDEIIDSLNESNFAQAMAYMFKNLVATQAFFWECLSSNSFAVTVINYSLFLQL